MGKLASVVNPLIKFKNVSEFTMSERVNFESKKWKLFIKPCDYKS